MSWDPTQHYKDTQVAEEYDSIRFSSLPGRVFGLLERRTLIRAYRDLPSGSVIADIPCGTGRLAEPLLEAGYRVHGIDISAEMLEVAKRRLQRFGDAFTAEVADARELRDRAPSYDACLCARVLMHFPLEEQIAFLAGVTKVAKNCVVINHSFSSPYQRFRRRIKELLRHPPPANFPVTNADIEKLLEGASLQETRRHRLLSPVSEAAYIVATPLSR